MTKGISFSVKWVTLVSAVAIAGISSAEGQKPIRFKVGVNSLSASSATDQVRTTGYAIALSYQLPSVNGAPNGASFFIDGEYARNAYGNRNLGIFSLGVSGLQPLGVPGSAGTFYGGLGLGLAFIDGDRASVNPGTGTGGGGGGGGYQTASALGSASRVRDFGANAIISDFKATRLYGSLMLGYEFTQGYFVEARYRLVASVESINPSSFGLFVGYKF